MTAVQSLTDVITMLSSIQDNDVRTQSPMILKRIEMCVMFLATCPAPGLSQADYVKFREHIETKIKGLAGSAGQFALKFIDTGNEDDRDTAKRYQAEETALREVLRELDDRRNMTLARLRDS